MALQGAAELLRAPQSTAERLVSQTGWNASSYFSVSVRHHRRRRAWQGATEHRRALHTNAKISETGTLHPMS